MKVKVRIPFWGTTVYEAASVETELASLRSKYPQYAPDITVEEYVEPRPLSAEEIAAQESPAQDGEN